jgi:hypothetical protein
VIWNLRIPVTQTVSGITSVVRNSTATVTFYFATESTAAERADLIAMVGDLVTEAAVKTAAANLEPFY